MRDTYLKYWQKRVDYSFTNGRGKHRYYALITAEKDFIKIEYHHLKRSLVSIICGKHFYDTIDIPGSPPKKHMEEFRNKILLSSNNYKALKLYRRIGFKEDFCYPQAYLMQKK